jgi:hypothetical protein
MDGWIWYLFLSSSTFEDFWLFVMVAGRKSCWDGMRSCVGCGILDGMEGWMGMDGI